MKMKLALIMEIALCMSVCPVNADLIWDSGDHVFSEGSEDHVEMYNEATAEITGGWIGEFYMYNKTVADVTGGEIQVLLGQDTSSVSVYDGSTIGLLRPNDTSTAYVHGGAINHLFALGSSVTRVYSGNIEGIDPDDASILYLYTEDYQFDPTGGIRDGGGNNRYMADFWNQFWYQP